MDIVQDSHCLLLLLESTGLLAPLHHSLIVSFSQFCLLFYSFCFFGFASFFLFFSHTHTTWLQFLSLNSAKSLPPPSLSPKSTLPLFSFFKKIRSLTEYGLKGFSQTEHKFSYHGWMWWSSIRIRVPSTGKKIQKEPHFHCWESHKNTKLCNHKIYTEDLIETLFFISVSVSPYELCLVDSVLPGYYGVLELSESYNPSSSSSMVFLWLYLVFDYRSLYLPSWIAGLCPSNYNWNRHQSMSIAE